jgi:hypothetical protein
MKTFFLTFCFLLACYNLHATTYYISNGGNDSNNGTSPSFPWETLNKVNLFSFNPGDSVLFNRNGVWRGQLIPQSGDINGHKCYGAYGTGNKPILMGSWNISNSLYWENFGGNIWSTIVSISIPLDVGNIIFDYASSFGIKKWHETDLLQQGDYWYDTLNNKVNLFSTSNPAVFYNDIECALAYNIIHQENKSYIIYENLAIKYGAGHGIGGGNTDNIIIRSCDISYIGGGAINHPVYGWVRYGNGIEFWANASNNLVEQCKVWEIYDAAMTNQNEGSTAIQTNIIYRNNLIYNAEWSFEYWNRPTGSLTQNIYFINNTCLYAGNTWAHAQRLDKRGRHLNFFQIDAATNNFYILNNIFYEASSAGLYLLRYSDIDSLTLDYNTWYQTQNDTLIDIKWGTQPFSTYTMTQFSDYQNTYQQDINSIAENPEFVDINNENYQLSVSSHCVNAGIIDTISIPVGEYDLVGNDRIQGVPPRIDMGCYESDYVTGFFINDLHNTGIAIYPNPFSEKTTIEITSSNNQKYILTIFDLFGSEIMKYEIQNQKTEISRKDLPNGIYFYQVKDNKNNISTGKLILQ